MTGDRIPITLAPIDLGADRILRVHGYADVSRIRPRARRPIVQAVTEMTALAKSLIQPAVHSNRFDIAQLDAGQLRLSNGIELASPAFDRFLAHASGVVLFVLTAGPAIDDELQRLNAAGDLLRQLFLDTAGWMIVEAITKQMVIQLRARVTADGLRLSRRMGPGYSYPLGDGGYTTWPLEDQRPLFAAFNDPDLPIQLLDSCAMQPRMSRSGLLGLIPCTNVTAGLT